MASSIRSKPPRRRCRPGKKPKVAVCIGISKYGSDFDTLEGAETDAESVCRALNDHGYTRFPLNSEQATNGVIEETIAKAASMVSNGGTFVFFFAGHGVRAKDTGEQYLVTRGVQKANVREGALTVQWVVKELEKSGAEQRIVIVDACRTPTGERGDKSDPDAIRPEDYGTQTAILYSTTDGHPSWGDKSHGVFTQALVDGLDADSESWSGGFLYLMQLFDFVVTKTAEHAAHIKKEQSPALKLPDELRVRKIWLAGKPAGPSNKALVIVNQGNRSSSTRDGQDFAERLKGLGYPAVTTVLNPDPVGLQKAVTQFTEGLREGDRALVYYAGPGEVIDGEVYLNPIFTKNELVYSEGARSPNTGRRGLLDSERARMIRDQALSLQCIVQRLRRGPNGQNIIILDTSLEEKATDQPRQVPVISNEDDLRSLAIVFATGWNKSAGESPLGDHGIFTKRLLPLMGTAKTLGDLVDAVQKDVLADSEDHQKPWLIPETGRSLTLSGTLPGAARQ